MYQLNRKRRNQPYFGYVCINIILNTIKLTPFGILIIGLIILNINYYLTLIPIFLFLLILSKMIVHGKKFNKAQLIIIKKMLSLSDLKGNEKVLDLGTGSGLVGLNFAKYLDKGIVYAVDKWRNNSLDLFIRPHLMTNIMTGCSLKNVKQNLSRMGLKTKCQLIRVDFNHDFPFEDESFDIVVSSHSLYFITNSYKRKRLFNEINRVLKKGGKIILYEPEDAFIFNKWNISFLKNYFEKQGFKTNLIRIDEVLK